MSASLALASGAGLGTLAYAVMTRPLPETGSIFLDARGGDRVLRVSWHVDNGLVVLSLWRDNVCSGSFRLAVDDADQGRVVADRGRELRITTAGELREPAS